MAGLTDAVLLALKLASNETPQVAPGLLARIEGACDWEVHRRHGFHYTLQPPRRRLIRARMPLASTRRMPCGRPLPPMIKTTARSRSSTRWLRCLAATQPTSTSAASEDRCRIREPERRWRRYALATSGGASLSPSASRSSRSLTISTISHCMQYWQRIVFARALRTTAEVAHRRPR